VGIIRRLQTETASEISRSLGVGVQMGDYDRRKGETVEGKTFHVRIHIHLSLSGMPPVLRTKAALAWL